jgi:cytochrome c
VNAAAAFWDQLLLVAANHDRIDLLSLLLEHGANPNAAAPVDGQTALHVAASRGCLACVKALIEAGAGVNAVTRGDWAKTPVHLAKLNEHRDVEEYLLAHGVILPRPKPISAKLGSADPEKGKRYFSTKFCSECHDVKPTAIKKSGPVLWNVVGRAKASVPGQNYSKALQAWGGTWTYEDLNIWLFGPAVTTPGVLMEIAGVSDDSQRADLIVYLRSLSDKPLTLPALQTTGQHRP